MKPLEREIPDDNLPVVQNPIDTEFITPTPTNTPIPTLPPILPDYIYVEVTKTHGLGRYAPDKIVEVPRQISKRKVSVSPIILNDLIKMMDAAKEDNIDLKVVSAYRSYDEQSDIFDEYVKYEMSRHPGWDRAEAEEFVNTYSARPGFSEHQLGTTVDILSIESNYTFNTNNNMKFVRWLEENAPKYNFRISYPKNNGEYKYEPWHLRWWPK